MLAAAAAAGAMVNGSIANGSAARKSKGSDPPKKKRQFTVDQLIEKVIRSFITELV